MQLAAILRAELERLPRGRILPSMRSLTQAYGVSDGTVKRALRELRAEGLIVTYKGKGSFKA